MEVGVQQHLEVHRFSTAVLKEKDAVGEREKEENQEDGHPLFIFSSWLVGWWHFILLSSQKALGPNMLFPPAMNNLSTSSKKSFCDERRDGELYKVVRHLLWLSRDLTLCPSVLFWHTNCYTTLAVNVWGSKVGWDFLKTAILVQSYPADALQVVSDSSIHQSWNDGCW